MTLMIFGPYQKQKGAPFNWHKAYLFNCRINHCNVMEIETQGGKFTWKALKNLDYLYPFEKLDCALCNVVWRLSFSKAFARILSRVFFNHYPIVIDIKACALDR